MKINGVNGSNLNPYQKQLQKQGQVKPTTQHQDKVEISNKAKQLQKEQGIAKVRKEKVENLKQQVQNGEYDINSKKTAEKMIDFWTNKRM
ncbi:flagellar biosynthesis anti-sigma factor FlgM [Piscibacillus halophilus]|uniref:Negative regulator of flagellin synthesis n=1 Tax=Piscibacillus halophilus TaxID=571933 RepID=A0A1H9EI90_9BACI|nr:flagellar biosynthesis anti-sigma factor FlgM [Piscibacillus halophilus]SEQ25444.1 anti-sigma-28 factor, FlgM family [Piscibacillus halophilus]